MRAAEVALAYTKRITDVTVSAAWRHGRDWDDQTAVAGFSIPLQVFHRYEGAIAASEATEHGARLRANRRRRGFVWFSSVSTRSSSMRDPSWR